MSHPPIIKVQDLANPRLGTEVIVLHGMDVPAVGCMHPPANHPKLRYGRTWRYVGKGDEMGKCKPIGAGAAQGTGDEETLWFLEGMYETGEGI